MPAKTAGLDTDKRTVQFVPSTLYTDYHIVERPRRLSGGTGTTGELMGKHLE